MTNNVSAEALDAFARDWALTPGDPALAQRYGVALQKAGRHGEAAPLFRVAFDAFRTDPAPALNLSTSLLALGDTDGAIAAARKGRLRGPAMKEAHYMLGVAYLAGGFLERALACFRAATRIAPDFADAWVNMGVAHYRNGEIHRAKAAMRSALAVAPGHPAATANLGVFLRLTGEAEEAEPLLHDFAATHPEAHAARLNAIADLLGNERPAEALALLEGPLPDDPAMRRHWELQRVLALIQLRRPDEARAVMAGIGPLPAGLAPLRLWREAMLAANDGDAQAAAQAVDAMAAALETNAEMVPEHRIIAHYDIARFWSRRAAPDKAMAHWTLGHRHLAAFQPFSRAAFAEFVDASIETFSAARFAEGPRADNADPAPVFIVGMPRSGTTLCEQILAAHSAVHGAGERSALSQAFWRLGGGDTAPAVRRAASAPAPMLQAVAASYLQELHALAPAAHRVVDKMPGNFRHLGLAALLLPGARIIACDRDPRDIGLSIFTFRFFGVHAYANDLADLGWYIGQQRRLMAHWRAVLLNPILTIRLADWVEDFDSTLRRLLAFLDLPYDTACETFYEVDRQVRTASRRQVREKINARGLGRWRPYEKQLQPLLAALNESGALDGLE